MSWVRKREIPIAITAVAGLLMLIDYYFAPKGVGDAVAAMQNWSNVIAAFALGVGMVALSIVHLRNILKLRESYGTSQPYLSILLLVVMYFTFVTGISQPLNKHPAFLWLFNNAMMPLEATIYSLLGFWIASAAYRAFTARNVEAILMLFAAVIAMLVNAPIGAAIWSGFPVIGRWILDVPNTAGNRGIMIGAALGAIALGLRTLLGMERGQLGGR